MIRKSIYYIAGIIFFCSVAACGSYDCGEAEGLRISTISLTAGEIDTIVLRKFIKGSGFTNLVDTLVIDSSNVLFQFPFASQDTSYMGILKPEVLLRSRFDYQIYIPAVNRLVKITDINEPQRKMKRTFISDKTYCINSIQSFQQDGRTVSLIPYGENSIYIHR